jgi:hypothetical protein
MAGLEISAGGSGIELICSILRACPNLPALSSGENGTSKSNGGSGKINKPLRLDPVSPKY